MIKVLLITVRSDFGGGPRHVHQLVNGLPEQICVYIAYPIGGEPYSKLWKKNKSIIDRIIIPYRKFSIVSLISLVCFVYTNKIDIVHSHGNGAGIYSRLLKILCPKIKVVHTYHGISDSYRSLWKKRVGLLVGRILAPFCDLYICVSNGEKEKALERKFSRERNTQVVYNGIPCIMRGKERHIQCSPLKIVTLSRFDYQKNMDSMYKIAKHWIGSDKVRFIWVGDGEDRARLETMANKENVPISFVGFSKEPMKYLKDSDLYLSTSRFEGLPYALIEAASVGLPIIASDVTGNNEVVTNGYNGYLFEKEDDAVNLVNRIINKEIDYSLLSKNSIKFFRDNFTESKMLNSIVKLYEGCMDVS